MNVFFFVLAAVGCAVGAVQACRMARCQRERRSLWRLDAAVLAYVSACYSLAALMIAGVIPVIPMMRNGIVTSVGVAMLATAVTITMIAAGRAHGCK